MPVPTGHQLVQIQGDSPVDQTVGVLFLLGRGASPAQQGPNPGLHLQNVKGFGDVVVGTALKAHNFVRILALGGEHDDGHIGELPYLHARL